MIYNDPIFHLDKLDPFLALAFELLSSVDSVLRELDYSICIREVADSSLFISILTDSPLLVPGVPVSSGNNVLLG